VLLVRGGLLRQVMAMAAVGYDKKRLSCISMPSLIIHGLADPIFPPECGKDTALSIQNAELMLIEGMGHDIPTELYIPITNAIIDNILKCKDEENY